MHRVAYLVKVDQMRPRGILVLCFNRLAAIQLKQRLRELIGKAAARVTVTTYHSLAARLTGTSFAERAVEAGDAPINLATECLSKYSDMSIRTIACSSSNRNSANARASSVFPTPVGPINMNDPMGLLGS